MSYILDALRRADAERERGAVPGLHSQAAAPGPRPMPPAGARAPGYAAGGVALVVLGATAWWIGRSQAPVQAMVAAPAPGTTVATAPQGAAVATAAPGVTDARAAAPGIAGATTPPGRALAPAPPTAAASPTPAPPPLATAPPAAGTSPAPSVRPATTAVAAPPPPGAATAPPATTAAANQAATAAPPAPAGADPGTTPTTPAAATTAVPRAAPGAFAPGATPVSPAPAAPARPAEPRVVSYEQLPDDVRRQIPPLAIGGAIYSDTAASRMLIVGGQLLHEGETAAPGVVLEQIKPRSAVLRWRDLRYEVSY